MNHNKDNYINGILLIYKFPPGPNNTIDHINAFEEHSKFKVWKVNTLGGFPKHLEELRFRIIVLHYSFMYTINYSNPLTDQFSEYIDKCKESYKIAFFQDEHHTCKRRFKYINDHKIDCIYTLLEPDSYKEVYVKYTSVKKIISTLPCYVNDSLFKKAELISREDGNRLIDIGYRGRELPSYMGKGAQEKSEIAHKFKKYAQNIDLKLDIETAEKHRVYGDKWDKFVGNCKAMLGVEAGVSVFDVEDIIKEKYDNIMAITNEDKKVKFLNELFTEWEDRIYYRTVSPRQFELAAYKTCQILFEGKYSGVVIPMVHYIPLKKDFSNFDEVIKMYNDNNLRRELTENAYKDLILSGNYSYKRFIESFDAELIKEGFNVYVDNQKVNEVNRTLNKDLLIRRIISRFKSPMYRYFRGRDLLKNLAIKYMENKKKK